MDQQAAFNRAGDEEGFGPGPSPLAPGLLALSLVAIAGSGMILCCLLASAAVLILTARIGVDGVSDFYQELRFNIPLQTRIGAWVVSALYIGIAAATVAAAILRGRARWTALLALKRPESSAARARQDWRLGIGIGLVTLAYAAAATFTMARMQSTHLIVSGPTDVLLVGTILVNLGLLAPVCEELLFRGWLYTALRRRFRFWPSFLVTACLFAAIHWDANHRRIILVLPLAVALGLLREATASIKPTIALHAVYNLIIVAITLSQV